ncbi:hypothetical protein [Peterkaempfera bronchialis]|uniref:Uncharacterized protein n=1 Tax=Peterkaempfera bronchialis TaxID=2126346 RepID=A0A345SX35_9ACTN|nr:hypothetical protein [Peterkaempfera bronchialis]AXI78290.1 hypothetical protein C7M71_013425 [Peterkaempfera bronchialis]
MPKPRRLITVPYITVWSGERRASVPALVANPRSGRIAYRRELLADRDERGVLWNRTESRPGKGRPQYARVHPYRQRYVMRHLRCQICASPADRSHLGVLWLLHDDRSDWPGWPEQMTVTHPPVCLPCARLATRLCPHLADRHVAVRVKNPRIHGVYGFLYTPVPGSPHPMPTTEVTVPYTDPQVRRVLAGQLVTLLRDCTLVDLADELATTATVR